ncbi:hypothetical protein CORMATOL_00028 [Corynebacterium matruchotii ATCC 33806]|uniref:Uncharacterized protein n=1 Tax=Corynebacterium matruchotii ATCC 33806 TaxID=566549 RepID=C0DZF0_9CORY|nr:hypothetical protein CORMATOL_00028 [Corynebacterium matruchotii ATCC 33806]
MYWTDYNFQCNHSIYIASPQCPNFHGHLNDPRYDNHPWRTMAAL